MQLTGQFFKYPSFRVTSRPAPDCTDYLLVLPFAIDLVKPTTIRTDKVMTLDMSASFMCFAVGVNHKGTASISRRSTCLGLDTNALFLAKADHMPSAYKPSRVRIRITAGKSGNFLPCHDFRTLVPNASETFACKEQHKKKYLLTSQKKSTKNLALPGAYITAVQRVYIFTGTSQSKNYTYPMQEHNENAANRLDSTGHLCFFFLRRYTQTPSHDSLHPNETCSTKNLTFTGHQS